MTRKVTEKAIEEIDTYIKPIIDAMKEDDLFIITADHGCDPTVPGTDHTREKSSGINILKILKFM